MINLHKNAEQRSNTQSVIPAGAQVSYTGKKVTDNQGIDWAQVSYDGTTGWVKADGLRVEKPEYQVSHNAVSYADSEKIKQIAHDQNISFEHAKIIHYANQWEDVPKYKWTNLKFAKWFATGRKDNIVEKDKLAFISNYKDVIKDAAGKYDIPPLLLAGVAFIEFGGAPMLSDPVAYDGRIIFQHLPQEEQEKIKGIPFFGEEIGRQLSIPSDQTSFGNTSIQVRRAIEMLGYEDSTDKRGKIISSLMDPIQNIYMAACHLNILRNIDFAGKNLDELTDEDIQIIASRYNIGPEKDISTAKKHDYGIKIISNKGRILDALK